MDIRYRTETFSGMGYRDAAEVMAFETFEMGNTDIMETLIAARTVQDPSLIHTMKGYVEELDANGFIDDLSEADAIKFFGRVLDEIRSVTGYTIKYALWLADEDTVMGFYGKDEILPDDVDAYEIGPVVLSELGYDGTLYGYESCPEPIIEVR